MFQQQEVSFKNDESKMMKMQSMPIGNIVQDVLLMATANSCSK